MPENDPRDWMDASRHAAWRRRPQIISANAYYMFAAIGLVLLNIVYVAVATFADGLNTTVANTVMQVLYYLLAMVVPVAIYISRHQGVEQSMRLKPIPVSMGILAVALAIVASYFVNYLLIFWFMFIEGLGGIIPATAAVVPTTKPELMLAVLVSGMLPGVCEELLFRGMVLGAWERRGARSALVTSSILFALMHGSVAGLPAHMLLGFLLGYLVMMADSIYAGMIFHTAYNSISLIFSFLQAGSEAAASGTMYERIGGMAGALQALMAFAFFGLIFLVLIAAVYMMSKNKEALRARPSPTPLHWREILPMAAGLVTVSLFYMMDLLRVLRVLP